MPKVSVLIPIYNVEKYLEKCLKSAVGQSLKDIQIICINDGSKDSSLEIIKNFQKNDSRIKIIDKENTGYGDSMNIALNEAEGEYISILEPDDFADGNMLEDLYQIAKEHDLDIVKADFYNYTTKNNISRKSGRIKKEFANKVINIKDYINILKLRPAIWSSIYKREFLNKNNIRFLPTKGASYQDVSFNFKALALAEKIYLTTNAYIHYRIDNPNSSVKDSNKANMILGEYDEISDFLNKNPKIKEIVNTRKLLCEWDNYLWTLSRIDDKYKDAFLDRFIEAFRKAYSNNEINEDFFKEVKRSEFEALIRNKKEFLKCFNKKMNKKKWHDIRSKILSIRINSSRISVTLFDRQIIALNF